MRKLILLALTFISACALAGGAATNAATTTIDLATSGSVVPTIWSADVGQELAFLFTTTNKSTTASAELNVTFTVRNGIVRNSDYICNLISNHHAISPDTPSCEPGLLGPAKATRNAILVTATATGTMTVKACSTAINGYSDPVSSNNCKTLTVKIV